MTKEHSDIGDGSRPGPGHRETRAPFTEGHQGRLTQTGETLRSAGDMPPEAAVGKVITLVPGRTGCGSHQQKLPLGNEV